MRLNKGENMSNQFLLSTIIISFILGSILFFTKLGLKYDKQIRQQTFCYCPLCFNELISSNSFVSDEEFVTYKCSKCGLVSRWDFGIAPVPILIKKGD